MIKLIVGFSALLAASSVSAKTTEFHNEVSDRLTQASLSYCAEYEVGSHLPKPCFDKIVVKHSIIRLMQPARYKGRVIEISKAVASHKNANVQAYYLAHEMGHILGHRGGGWGGEMAADAFGARLLHKAGYSLSGARRVFVRNEPIWLLNFPVSLIYPDNMVRLANMQNAYNKAKD